MKKLAALAVLAASLAMPAWATVQTVTLSVPGMTCPACPITVKTVLSRINGVSRGGVHYDAREAVVTFDAKTTAQKLTDATKDAGYRSSVKP
ncbi:mercuric transport protein periplasmic component (plasmid) [Burkholderia thailandensis 34]|uniref:mercury resistance system periplasmic binding protein MerP n=1 Tax=Burkholderia thailandensis TaxID=57975 RepID=UPI0005F1C808|nr:mercury resistance system periplasmic binding protein MerP [Burkholderia thailandensis]AJY27067.1 mercuric transport protein periplasmic component [Burkholderia thailandensis 34]AOJ58539.1 mercuric transport protein periplasmic component [Burkholderia thailandensis]KXF59761.1 mercuric transport protein periplasmic component [Burkholderia thailandensis]PNE73191.1 mercuric transport protein periplasmic component [Burkholderia thailandensis]